MDRAELYRVNMKDETTLQQDTFFAILIYLPVKSLIRFRCVSKYWRELIKSPTFVDRHLKRDCKESILLKRYIAPPNYKEIFRGGENILSFHNLDFPDLLLSPNLVIPFLNDINGPEYIQIFGPCNGLVCLVVHGDTVILCNPALREFKLLAQSPFACPNGYSALYVGSGFGLDANTNCYKLVQICYIQEKIVPDEDDFYYQRQEDTYMRVDLYNSSKNSWKLIDPVLPDIMYNPGFDLFFNGACHWQARVFRTDLESLPVILSFDVSTEIFQQFEFPHWFEDGKHPGLTVLNQCLALVRYRDWMNDEPDLVDIWVMKEYGNQESWTKEFSMGPYQFRRVFFYLENEWLLVETTDGQLASCSLHENKIETYQFHGHEDSFRAVIFMESLISLC